MQVPSTISERIAHLVAKLSQSEVGYIERIRAVYIDIEKDADIPLVTRDVVTTHLYRAVDTLLENAGKHR